MIESTPTYTDSLAEHKKLKDDISLLKQKKEHEEREFKQWAQANTAIQEKFGGLVDLEQVKDEIHSSLISTLLEQKDTVVKEITSLHSQRDNANAEATRARVHKTSLSADVEVLTKSKANLEEESKNKRDEHNRQLAEQKSELDSITKTLEKAQEDKKNAETDIKVIREEYELKRDFILKEEARLSIKARDVAIWEGRLRRKHAELYPGQDFIL